METESRISPLIPIATPATVSSCKQIIIRLTHNGNSPLVTGLNTRDALEISALIDNLDMAVKHYSRSVTAREFADLSDRVAGIQNDMCERAAVRAVSRGELNEIKDD